MRRYATFTNFSGYDPEEERKIKKIFEQKKAVLPKLRSEDGGKPWLQE